MLNIRNPEVERLVRSMAAEQGVALTEVILFALQNHRSLKAGEQVARLERLRQLGFRAAVLPVLDARTPEQILGFDRHGAFE
jgi:antitoxin VapB